MAEQTEVQAPEAVESEQEPQVEQAETPQPLVTRAAPEPKGDRHFFWGTGRRKKAIARVRIRPGGGEFTVNKRPADEYFVYDRDRNTIRKPLAAVSMADKWDIFVNVSGGGFTGQAGAVLLGLARALAKALPEIEQTLRDQGLLTRDARAAERKKYGQKGARKRFQFSKR